jgi:hypothetical protein
MKKAILYSFLFYGLITMFNACRKDDVQPPSDLRFPLPLLTKDTTGDEFISGRDPASFLGKFVVDMYYGIAVKPQKIDVVVIRNDNKTNVKIIKADVTNFPASIEITGTQLTTLFDSTIKLGDKFEIGADVTTLNGQKFEAFPVTGNPYGADTSALPGSRFSIVYVTTCRFEKASFAGWYTVVHDSFGAGDWGDLQAGDLVMVGPGAGENEISIFAYPYNESLYTRYPTSCQVDPVTFDVTLPRRLVGDAMFSYPFIWVEQGTGTVNPCGDAITLNMTLSAVYYTAPAPGDILYTYSETGILELRK